MKRALMTGVAVSICFLLNPAVSPAGKEREKPVQERYAANIRRTRSSSVDSLTIAIREFTPDQDLQGFARAYNEGGEDALAKSMASLDKGFVQVENGKALPIEAVFANSDGGRRRLEIIAQAAEQYLGNSTVIVFSSHEGFPFTCVQLDLDAQGKGEGVIVPYAKLTFTKDGRMVVKPMDLKNSMPKTSPLLNVYRLN